MCAPVLGFSLMGGWERVIHPPWPAKNLLIPLLQEKALQNQIFILLPAKVHPPQLNNSFHVVT